MNDIVIFGSTGFIGSNIYNYLVENEHDTMGFSSDTCNLLDQEDIKNVFAHFKNNFSLIICSSITSSVDNSLESMFYNIQMIENIVKSIPIDLINNIIYLSSVDVYGSVKDSRNIDENTQQRSVGYYGLSKLVCENLLSFNIQDKPIALLRLPGIYGHGDKYKSIVGKFIHDAHIKKKIKITNDGNCLRDYVEVSDLCKIVNHFIQNPFNGAVIVATGHSLTIHEIAETVINKVNNKTVIENINTHSSSEDLLFDNSLFRSIMPSFNFIDINTGIEKYIKTI